MYTSGTAILADGIPGRVTVVLIFPSGSWRCRTAADISGSHCECG